MGIRRILARIRHIGSGRGFGIQSPADYSFVCNVINERMPYYAYEELKKQLPNLTRLQRRKCELLFRIANFLQPQATVNIGMPQCFEKYVLGGCKKTTIHKIYNNVSEIVGVLDIDSTELATFDDTDKQYLEQLCTLLTEAIYS